MAQAKTKRLEHYFKNVFENESFTVYEFIDQANEEREKLILNTDWNRFICIQDNNLDLTKKYDVSYNMMQNQYEEDDEITVISDNPEKAYLDFYAKENEDQFFTPSTESFAFNKEHIPSSAYF